MSTDVIYRSRLEIPLKSAAATFVTCCSDFFKKRRKKAQPNLKLPAERLKKNTLSEHHLHFLKYEAQDKV